MSHRKIVGYKAVYGSNPKYLSEAVNSVFSEGYEPWGSPFVIDDGDIIQAMVKYEDKTDE